MFFSLWAFSDCPRDWKSHLNTIEFAKTYFEVHVSVGSLDFLLREMDQKLKFGGTFGYGDSYLEYLLRHFKVLRLYAVLHDAAGAIRAHSF